MGINSRVAALPDGRATRMGDVRINSGLDSDTFANRPIAVRLSERISMSENYILAVNSKTGITSSVATAVL